MKNNSNFGRFLIGFIIFSMCVNYTPTVRAATANNFTGNLTSTNENIVSDDQWIWFRVVVGLGLTAKVQLTYEGALNIDLRVYWKRDNSPEFNGFDLTHCPINDSLYKFADNSQFRTTNTTLLGYPEEISFRNPSYYLLADTEAYVVIFVHSGKGTSTYTINSTIEMEEIHDDQVYDCNSLLTVYIIYIIISAGLLALSAFLIKRKKSSIIKSQETQKKVKKKEEKPKDVIDLETEYDSVRK